MAILCELWLFPGRSYSWPWLQATSGGTRRANDPDTSGIHRSSSNDTFGKERFAQPRPDLLLLKKVAIELKVNVRLFKIVDALF
jgi:hypothetical protein